MSDEHHKHYHIHLWPSGDFMANLGGTIVITLLILAFNDVWIFA